MNRNSTDLLRYPRRKHKHRKMRLLEQFRKMRALCDDLDGSGFHVISDALEHIMLRNSQEQQPAMDPGVQGRINQLINELRNLQQRQQDLQKNLNSLQGQPQAMQQIKALSTEMQQVMSRIAEINSEMAELQRGAGG